MESNPTHPAPTDAQTFWEDDRVFRLMLKAGNIEGARRTLYRMTQLYPALPDFELRANKAVIHNALALDKIVPNFNLAYFVPFAIRLADTDWTGRRHGDRIIPSLGQRITNRLMAGIAHRSDDYVRGVMPFFRKALQHNPSNKDNLRHLAQLYIRVRLRAQALALYRQLLAHHHDPYLYAEMADLVDDTRQRVALLCQAIVHQPREAYNMGYRYRLAELLHISHPARAAYEIRRSVSARQKLGQELPADVARIARILAESTPVSEADEQAFYQRMAPIARQAIEGRDL